MTKEAQGEIGVAEIENGGKGAGRGGKGRSNELTDWD